MGHIANENMERAFEAVMNYDKEKSSRFTVRKSHQQMEKTDQAEYWLRSAIFL